MLGSSVGGEPGVNKLLVGARLRPAGGDALPFEDAGKLGERCTSRKADCRRWERCWSEAGPKPGSGSRHRSPCSTVLFSIFQLLPKSINTIYTWKKEKKKKRA
ncbi:hypothetical protein T02_6985 [Trichinella nativa]|uniref:Uncharacterized protein n=1 Tax=Trichinella nativa TaxID=6335 RepID=A0A0V1L9P2_9BILA|nr:hypothetical protein T02_6985 [Trichinella nativa]